MEKELSESREQKHLIEEKHKEITDSINYAERSKEFFGYKRIIGCEFEGVLCFLPT